MAFISDQQLSKVQNYVQKQHMTVAKAKAKAEEKFGEMKGTLECVGAAAAMGYLRGTKESPDGIWNAPWVEVDMELLGGLTLVGLSFFDVFGKYDDDVLNMGNGILAHYSGQIMRKMGKTGKFPRPAVAGSSYISGSRSVGALPQYDRTSYGRTQLSSPYADPVAQALAEAGV